MCRAASRRPTVRVRQTSQSGRRQRPGGRTGGGLPKQAEHRGPAAGHGGGDGAGPAQGLDHLPDPIVTPRDGRLQVIHDADRPVRPADVDGPRYGGVGDPGGAVGIEPPVRVRRRHPKRRLDHDDAEPADIVDGIDLVAACGAERRAAEEEERHVGPEPGRERVEGRLAETAVPDAVEADEGGRRVGAAATEAGRCRDPLLETHVRPARITVAAERPPERQRGAPDQVRPVRRNPRRAGAQCEGPRPRGDRQRVVQRDRLQQRADVVVAVRPLRPDTEREIDLRAGAKNERPVHTRPLSAICVRNAAADPRG